jgi:outer membrane protein assembly factor BamB
MLLALFLTLGALPFAWLRLVGKYFSLGVIATNAFMMLIVVLGSVSFLAWVIARRGPLHQRKLAIASVALAVLWIAAVSLHMMWQWRLFESDLLTVPLVAAASLPIPWLAWMPLLGGGVWKRLIVTLSLVGLSFFLASHCEIGLSGESQPVLSWRRQPKVSMGSSTFGKSPASSDGSSLVDRSFDHETGAALFEHEYPQFLGPDRTAALSAVPLADWQDHPPKELWRRSVGAAWSSFATSQGIAITQEQRGEQECVTAYRLHDGQPLWVHQDAIHFQSSLGGPGPRATPTIVDNFVYTMGATGRLNCLRLVDGQPIWHVQTGDAAHPPLHGCTGSPLVVEDLVIVNLAHAAGPCIAAFARDSGTMVWETGLHRTSYASPHPAQIAGIDQVLLHHEDGLESFSLQDGRTLWYYPFANSERTHASQPIVLESQDDADTAKRVFVSTGYGGGSVLLEIAKVAAGSSASVDSWEVREQWRSRELETKFCTAVVRGQTVFGLDNGILEAVDLASGTRLWKSGRFGHGQVLLADDQLIILGEDGTLVLAAAEPEGFRKLGQIKALTGKTWNHACLAMPYLLVRNDGEAVCYHVHGR